MQDIEEDEATCVPPPTGTASLEAVPVQVAPEVRLSKEQNEILATVLKGENVFFTGPAGWTQEKHVAYNYQLTNNSRYRQIRPSQSDHTRALEDKTTGLDSCYCYDGGCFSGY